MGAIDIDGLSQHPQGNGVLIDGAQVNSGDGTIKIEGDNPGGPWPGWVLDRAQISSAAGNIDIRGGIDDRIHETQVTSVQGHISIRGGTVQITPEEMASEVSTGENIQLFGGVMLLVDGPISGRNIDIAAGDLDLNEQAEVTAEYIEIRSSNPNPAARTKRRSKTQTFWTQNGGLVPSWRMRESLVENGASQACHCRSDPAALSYAAGYLLPCLGTHLCGG